MNKTIVLGLLCALCVGLNAFSKEAEVPLPDYIAQFNEADARIRSSPTAPGNQYLDDHIKE